MFLRPPIESQQIIFQRPPPIQWTQFPHPVYPTAVQSIQMQPRFMNPVYIPNPMPPAACPPQMPESSEAQSQHHTPARKRKSNEFLPSPEASPQNGYIGQHSQGIGGHYPDSYYNKKLKTT